MHEKLVLYLNDLDDGLRNIDLEFQDNPIEKAQLKANVCLSIINKLKADFLNYTFLTRL